MNTPTSRRRWLRLSTLPRGVAWLLCFGAGVILGLFLHYVFYRLSLPLEPFIYVTF